MLAGERAPVEGGLYQVAPAGRARLGMINRRRQIISPILAFDVATHHAAAAEMFERCGHPEYAGSLVGEMASRPIVEASKPGSYAAATDAFKKWGPRIIDWILERTVREPLTFNNASRVGSPVVGRVWSKKDTLMPRFKALAAMTPAEISEYVSGLYNVINIRLQPEKVGRVREMTFISNEGEIYRAGIGPEQRQISNRDGDVTGTAQRTRTIYMPNHTNLATGFVDNALHHPLLRSRACKVNMFGGQADVLPRAAEAVLCTDIRHMDRHTGEIVRYYASIIGGRYEQLINAMLDQPYLVPSDGWTTAFWVWVTGVSQLPSGISPVAILQKLAVLSGYCEFASVMLHKTDEHALEFVLNGGDGSFWIRSYGDDNALAGDKKLLDSWMSFASEMFAIEEEIPPKYLGFEYSYQNRTFTLTDLSYEQKTWFNEREPRTMWRPNPHYGWVLRRQAYLEYGDAKRMREVYAIEDDVLQKHGLPWTEIQQLAIEEEKILGPDPMGFNVLNKEWLLSPEERAELPGYEKVEEKDATEMVLALVGDEMRRKLFPSAAVMQEAFTL